jgi:hypothetical protein
MTPYRYGVTSQIAGRRDNFKFHVNGLFMDAKK